jgi:hypothetical protein
MAKKSAGFRFVNDQTDIVIRPGATSSPMPSAPTPPSRPPGVAKDSIFAPEVPIVSNDEAASDTTQNDYVPNDSVLQGGASDAPRPSDKIRPVHGDADGVAPLPGAGAPRPDVA